MRNNRKYIGIVAMFAIIILLLVSGGCNLGNDDEYREMSFNPIYNLRPEADFGCENPYAKGAVRFINNTVDPNNDPMTFRWDFSDGSISYECEPRHIFSNQGDYEITLIAEDDHHTRDTCSRAIHVNQTPKIDILLDRICTNKVGDNSGNGELYILFFAFNGKDSLEYGTRNLTYSVAPGECIPFGRLWVYSETPDDYIAFLIIVMDRDDPGFWKKIIDFAIDVFSAILTEVNPIVGSVIKGLGEIAAYVIEKTGEDDPVIIYHDALLPIATWGINQTHNYWGDDYYLSYTVQEH